MVAALYTLSAVLCMFDLAALARNTSTRTNQNYHLRSLLIHAQNIALLQLGLGCNPIGLASNK